MTNPGDQVAALAGRPVRLRMRDADGFLWGTVGPIFLGRLWLRAPIGRGAALGRLRGRGVSGRMGSCCVRLDDIAAVDLDPLMETEPFRKIYYCSGSCFCLIESCGIAYIGLRRGEITGPEISALIKDELTVENDPSEVVHLSWETPGEITPHIALVREMHALGINIPRNNQGVFIQGGHPAFPGGSTAFL